VTAILAGVDLTLGPLITLIIANPNKPRRELARDVGMVVVIQIVALGYGATTLWHGRPLYYAFSVNELQMVQASDLPPNEVALAWKQNPDFVPHWYSRPRWVWAPLPADNKERQRILNDEILNGGADVIQMPRYFKPWRAATGDMRKSLKKVDEFFYYTKQEEQSLKERMAQRGFAADQPITLILTGRDTPVVAVFDPKTMQIKAILRAD
jgi:hypothetical protein